MVLTRLLLLIVSSSDALRKGHQLFLPALPLSGWRGVHPEERDNKVNAKIGHEIGVRLAAASGAARNGRVAHLHCAGCVTVDRFVRRGPIPVFGILVGCSAAGSTKQGMGVSGCILGSKRDLFNARHVCEVEAVTIMDREPTLQVWQRKCGLPVAAIRRADQLKKHFILRNWQQLSLTEHPAVRIEVSGEHPDFAYIWFTHRSSPY